MATGEKPLEQNSAKKLINQDNSNKLAKLGRCDSSTIEWIDNRTARMLGLLAETARTARLSAYLVET